MCAQRLVSMHALCPVCIASEYLRRGVASRGDVELSVAIGVPLNVFVGDDSADFDGELCGWTRAHNVHQKKEERSFM